jgi:hypothetical protein
MESQDWLEMKDIRRRRLEGAVWVPLRAAVKIREEGRYGRLGYVEEFFGVGSVAIPLKSRSAARALGWSHAGIAHSHQPHIEEQKYIPSDVYSEYGGKVTGLHLALEQRGNRIELHQWHLHQDFILAFGLKREGDLWLSQDEGYVEVARLRKTTGGKPVLLEVKSEYLKEYLCARGMVLFVTSYRQRVAISENAGHINWANRQAKEEGSGDRWEGSITEIHEGGHPFGATTAVFHAARTDIDPYDDVPTLGPPGSGNIESSSWTVTDPGRKLYRVQGSFWRDEWVEPAALSPRIREDPTPPSVFFVTDAEGKRESRETLKEAGRWLWFRPDVVMALAHRRGGALTWYTRDTGGVRCSPDYDVHFGLNGLGIVTVYAKDIALLPDWQQAIWAGSNVGPEGGVSEELLASQVRAEPAETLAPEEFLPKALAELDKEAWNTLGFPLFRHHEQVEDLLSRSHRFRALDREGLYALAKDLARIIVDRLDAASMQRLAPPPPDTKWGSLKSLEGLLATRIPPGHARVLVGPLVGIYELRHGDAHLPRSDLEEALRLTEVDTSAPFVHQGQQLLHSCVSALFGVLEVLKHWNSLAPRSSSKADGPQKKRQPSRKKET